MIVLNLCCSNHHPFEGWFSSSDDFSRQSANGMIVCPVCNDGTIIRKLSAPHVKRVVAEEQSPTQQLSTEQLQAVLTKLTALADESENVGDRFPEEARKIHYDMAPIRNIRGIASAEETKDLIEEGIPVIPLPVPPKEETH